MFWKEEEKCLSIKKLIREENFASYIERYDNSICGCLQKKKTCLTLREWNLKQKAPDMRHMHLHVTIDKHLENSVPEDIRRCLGMHGQLNNSYDWSYSIFLGKICDWSSFCPHLEAILTVSLGDIY